MRVLSLGAGVQSSTLLLMAYRGDLELDSAIFADTGWEPRAVYAYLDWLVAQPGMLQITRVANGNIRELTAASHRDFATLPLYVEQATDGSHGMLRRQCTKEYKITPVRRALRALNATAANPVDLLYGISLDEAVRMRDSQVKYIRNVYPLVDMRMTRADCILWLERNGYPEPPKSACVGCPYRKDSQWRALEPDEMADAIEFDKAIRDLPRVNGTTYLHRSMQPLSEVDFSNERDHGQLDLWAEECEGVCGV